MYVKQRKYLSAKSMINCTILLLVIVASVVAEKRIVVKYISMQIICIVLATWLWAFVWLSKR